MKGEINREWYCSADFIGEDKRCHRDEWVDFPCCNKEYCSAYHRKHPTPEQFKEEYGEEYPDDGAVYSRYKGKDNNVWLMGSLEYSKAYSEVCVCACTPWGKPPNDWRPEWR